MHEIDKVGFQLNHIETLQFATNDAVFDESKEVQLQAGLHFDTDFDNKQIRCTTKFQFECEVNIPFVTIEASCTFRIEPIAWEMFLKQESGKLIIPRALLQHLAVITVGTVRGILHSEIRKTPFNHFLLPTVNLTEIIKEDIVHQLKEK